MEITRTCIPNLYAVWNEKIEDYEETGTMDECMKWILEHESNVVKRIMLRIEWYIEQGDNIAKRIILRMQYRFAKIFIK